MVRIARARFGIRRIPAVVGPPGFPAMLGLVILLATAPCAAAEATHPGAPATIVDAATFDTATFDTATFDTSIFDAAGCCRIRTETPAVDRLPGGFREEVDFVPSIRVDHDQNHEHREPAVAWGPAGQLYAVYVARYSHYNPERVLFSLSLDGGSTWQAPVQINDTSPNAVMMPSVAVAEDGAILVAWGEMKFAPYNNEIRFSRSADGGATWMPSVRVHPEAHGEDYYRPDLCIAGDRALVAFFREVAYPNGEPQVVASDDQGLTWSLPAAILSGACPYDGAPPRLAHDPDSGLLGAAVATSAELVVFARSSDGGASWEAPLTVNDEPSTFAGDPDLVFAAGRFHVLFADNRSGAYDTDVYHSSSSDGTTFSPNVRVNDSFPGNQYEAHLHAGPDGRLHAAWIWNQPFQSDLDLYYSRSDDAGVNWLAESPRVNDVPYTVEPYVAWTCDLLGDGGGEAYLFWNDGRTSGYYDNVYFTRSESHSAAPVPPAAARGPSLRVRGSFRASCLLQVNLPGTSARNRLSLHDLTGRLLWQGELGPLAAGATERHWTPVPGRGDRTAVRFVRLETRFGATSARWVSVR